MYESINLSEDRIVNLCDIDDVSEILDIQQNNIRMLCFTINMKDREIINVLQEYSKADRGKIHQEVMRIHQRIQDYLALNRPLPDSSGATSNDYLT